MFVYISSMYEYESDTVQIYLPPNYSIAMRNMPEIKEGTPTPKGAACAAWDDIQL